MTSSLEAPPLVLRVKKRDPRTKTNALVKIIEQIIKNNGEHNEKLGDGNDSPEEKFKFPKKGSK